MEDDNEVLDWGHEEEDLAARSSDRRALSVDDVEDAVSLGGDEDDEFLTYQSRVPQDSAHRGHSPPKSARFPRQEPSINRADSPFSLPPELPTECTGSSDQSSLHGRPHTLGAFVHALPPKPVAYSVPFVHPSHPSIIEATAMASRLDCDKRNGAGSKPNTFDPSDSLPTGWEVKYPRSGRGVYYYNIHTQESTWIRPTAPTVRDKRSDRVDRRDDLHDKYGDRYYRPADSGRREERPAPSAQLIDSYVPDSYTPNHRSTRSSPPPPRARERDPTPSPRRPLSPDVSHGDHDSVKREAPPVTLSAQDRVWVARDAVPLERQRDRRQRDDPPPETEYRHPPRAAERSSTLRPRSPASYTRGSQESANTTPHSSVKPSQPVLEGPPPGRRSRFSHADDPTQYRHRQSDSRDGDMRRARTDDLASHGTRHVNDLSSSRSMSHVRRDDDTPTYPASDAQRTRKRTPLPPQDETFRPDARSAPARHHEDYPSRPSSPAPGPDWIVSDEMMRDTTRRSLSPPPSQPLALYNDRGDRDRGRARWSKSQANGPPQMDPPFMHESSRGRGHGIAMDVDHTPPLRSSDPPTKHIPPRRPALQDELPRYPRAMLNSENDGPSRGPREAQDGNESRYHSMADDSPRFGPPKDRMGMEHHPADQVISQKESVRHVETRPAVSGSNVKLSGTNNIPIGARNKFVGGANAPPPSVPLSNVRRAPVVSTGSNGEPVAPRRDRMNKDHERPPHLDGTTGGRSGLSEPAKREEVRRSPPNNPRALPLAEPGPPPPRPSRAALGISRFGPPIVKENTEFGRTNMSASLDSIPSDQVPEGSARGTPPPPSRESSMTSFKEASVSVRPSHLPPRPASPSYTQRIRSGEPNKASYHPVPAPQSPVAHDNQGSNEVNAGVSERLGPVSPASRKRAMDAYPTGPPPPPALREKQQDAHVSQRPRTNIRDLPGDLVIPPAPPPVFQEEERAPPPMHPERAHMLQANGLPPRPLSVIGRSNRPGRGPKRDRRDDRDPDRAEPLRGNGKNRVSNSPTSERRRFPEDERPTMGRGASLLDRLSLDGGSHVSSPSLRDRVQLPSKRDREEMMVGDYTFEVEGGGEEYDGSKRVRRRGSKMRKGKFEV